MIIMMNLDSNFVLTCPACGFSFKKPNSTPNNFTCPMCRYKFKDSNDMSPKFDDLTV